MMCGVLISSGQAPQPAQAQGKTGLVLAHYYAWFSPGSFGAGKTPFNPPTPYTSSDSSTIQRHVNEAKSAGIDGFVQAWYGPSGQQTESNFRTLLDIASANGFKAAVNMEASSAFIATNEARISAITTLLSTHATHPAYLRVDGKPVIFFWANWAIGLGDWEYIRNQADPNRTAIWIGEGTDPAILRVFDGLYLYNIAWSANPAGVNSRFGGETRAATTTYGSYKYWAATAMPGFNDSLLGRGDATIVRDRSNGTYYQNSFSGAAASGPDLLLITSYNEWPEASQIEPSVELGSYYLDLTRDMVATYKAGGIPVAVPVAPVPPAATSTSGTNGTNNSGQPVAQTTPLPTNTPKATIAPLPTNTPLPDGRIIYNVQAGDTLISIAVSYGLTLDEIYALNNLKPDALLTIGQPIVVGFDQQIVQATQTAVAAALPAESPTPTLLEGYPNTTIRDNDGAIVYQVKPGNTLIEIAVTYDLTMEELYSLNGLTDQSIISIGQEIVVGYIPTPEVVGGSADLPLDAPTATPSPTMTPTPTFTPLPPTATPEATAISALPTAESAPTVTATAAPAVINTGSNQTANWFLAILGTAVLVLASLGGFFLYLGRRTG
jgi:LysM repeat protein